MLFKRFLYKIANPNYQSKGVNKRHLTLSGHPVDLVNSVPVPPLAKPSAKRK